MAIGRFLTTDYPDCDGRRPVMTLGMVLATADGEKFRGSGTYHRLSIADPVYKALPGSISNGVDAGVFAVQLHGMGHFRPPALMAASRVDSPVKAWLAQAPQSAREELPSQLQSRWVDASVLPVRALSVAEVRQAVQQEARNFRPFSGIRPGGAATCVRLARSR
jgi:hypothetical protein